MSIKLCQAANSVVTPLDDAQLYSWIANRAVGVVAGCAVTSAGTNQLAIAAGWGIVQGHVFTIGAETISAAVAPSGTVNGRLLIRIDTSDTVTPVEFITQAETPLPALTQEDIDGSGSIYELPLATYDVGTISISGLTNVAPTADKRQTAANTPIVDAGGFFASDTVEGALQALALGRSAQLGVPFLTGGIDKDTNKPIWGITQDHTFASLAPNFNTAFAVAGVTKFIYVELARVFGNDIVCGAQPVGSLAAFVAAQGSILRSAVELFLWGSAVATSTTWRFSAYYTL